VLLIRKPFTDENKMVRTNINYYSEKAKYDKEKQVHYLESVGVLEITDDEYAEICKYFPPKETEENSEEKTTTNKRYPALRTIATILTIFAWIVGIVAIISTIILGSDMGLLFAVLALISGGLIFVGLFAIAESINVNIDIEENTRKMAKNICK
jgi:hypothetical protein